MLEVLADSEETASVGEALLGGCVLALGDDQVVVSLGYRDLQAASRDLQLGASQHFGSHGATIGGQGEGVGREILVENAPHAIHVYTVVGDVSPGSGDSVALGEEIPVGHVHRGQQRR